MKNGAKDIKLHPWFRGLNWDQVLEQTIKPMFIPDVTGPGDTKYFKDKEEEPLQKSSQFLYFNEFYDLFDATQLQVPSKSNSSSSRKSN